MSDIEKAASSYLTTLNPLAKRIQQGYDLLLNSYADWDNLSWEQQEKVLDALVLDPDITKKYDSQKKTETETVDGADLPQCFPKLNINTGEKIVVDFDNDDVYTWRDEHSGPFAWRTRSQQDLSLLDEDFVPVAPERNKKKSSKKSHTPDREVNFAFKAEKSIWDSPFLVAEKGPGKLELFESDDFFQKFRSGDGDSQEMLHSPTKAAEDSKLLSSPHHENRSFQLDESDDISHPVETSSGCSSPRTLDTTHSRDDIQELSSRNSLDRLSSSERRRQDKAGQGKKWKSSSTRKELKLEAEQSLMSDLTTPLETNRDADHGQVSPVYIEDPGESFTDDLVFTYQQAGDNPGIDEVNANTTESLNVITSQPQSQRLEVSDDVEVNAEIGSSAMNESDMSKSGFDFLDDW